jgi:hypothetical protein
VSGAESVAVDRAGRHQRRGTKHWRYSPYHERLRTLKSASRP